MRKADIEDLAYLIKNSKEKPIIFLGAGASITGNIPIAKTIVEDILKKYKDNPRVRKDTEKTYKSLMDCLVPNERNTLLKSYIDNAKINVTHIYLAQFIKNELIDYVLTVNFDNLMLRALALYNIYPPTYDMAILKDITTSTFPTKSIVYLHGQHHGLWLLNTKEELQKVNKVIPPILNSIKDRPWIFIGYSANDQIFDHIAELGRFDKGLYWIAREEARILDKVKENLLDKENTNSFLIEGYDSDSFMLELNTKLGLEQPEILEKPFSYLKNCLDNIVDIQDEEHFKGIKERLEIIKTQVDKSIDTYENKDKENNLIKEIIDLRLKENFDEKRINEIYQETLKSKNQKLENSLSNLFNNWGNALYNFAKEQDNEALYNQALIKYETASILNPKDDSIFNNWGIALYDLAKTKDNNEDLYNQAFNKYETASKLNPKNGSIFYNWGIALYDLAKAKDNNEDLYNQAFSKYETASILNPKDDSIFNNWGIALYDLAKAKDNNEDLYNQAFSKYETASILNPKNGSIFNNWGTALYNLAKAKDNNEDLYNQAFNKYETASILNHKNHSIFYNWGTALYYFAKAKDDNEDLYNQAFEKLTKAAELGDKVYNLACFHSIRKNKKEAFELLEKAIENKEISISHILDDEDWDNFKEDEDFKKLIEKYR
ncbi:TPR end-of-group domain-containing protein [Aliarcobacter butzleri]|uniref:TPR end-of-group domain-containing protein n=2 Tax=Aliarcobacter butzleri TaxID=28197 RepID=UPI0024DE13CC|nr:SIR2 family protein [Aliarcobacter butzleri]MDK2051898.1 SIR2 family protein [Aliarcobacter butzleri]